MFFTARCTPGSQQTECAGAVIHQKWHAAVHTHPGDNMYVATAIPALWKRLTQPAGYFSGIRECPPECKQDDI